MPIGEAVGVITHVESFWRFRFPGGLRAEMDGAEALEVMQDFEVTLGSIELVREDRSSQAA